MRPVGRGSRAWHAMARDVRRESFAGRRFGGDREEWTGYIYTDRPVYRPGHTVHFKGILRVRKRPMATKSRPAKRVKVEIQDPDQKPVYQKTLTVSANGTIHDDLTLAANAALGNYYHSRSLRRKAA